MNIIKEIRYGLISLVLVLVTFVGCSPPADNYLRLAEIYQAQGKPAAAYNALKDYLRLNPTARPRDELPELSREIDFSVYSGPSNSDLEEVSFNRDKFLKSYLRQTVQKMKEYEKDYSHLKMTWEDKGSDLHPGDRKSVV